MFSSSIDKKLCSFERLESLIQLNLLVDYANVVVVVVVIIVVVINVVFLFDFDIVEVNAHAWIWLRVVVVAVVVPEKGTSERKSPILVKSQGNQQVLGIESLNSELSGVDFKREEGLGLSELLEICLKAV